MRAERTDLFGFVERLELTTLTLYYEDVLANPTSTLSTTCCFLGLSPRAIIGSTKKNTSDNLRDVIENYDELRSFFTGSDYEPMFDQ